MGQQARQQARQPGSREEEVHQPQAHQPGSHWTWPNHPNTRGDMADDARIRATGVKAPHGGDTVEIQWADGITSRYPHSLLRGYCPCAGCQGHSGTINFVEGGNLDLVDIEQVGNYALSFRWGDGHATGIYTFRYLRALGDLVATRGDEIGDDMPELSRA